MTVTPTLCGPILSKTCVTRGPVAVVPSAKSQRKLSGLPPGSVLPEASSTTGWPIRIGTGWPGTAGVGATSLICGGRVICGLSGCTMMFVLRAPFDDVAVAVVLDHVARHVDPVGELHVEAPAIVLDDVILEDPVPGGELVLLRVVAEEAHAAAVVADELIAATDRVVAHAGHDDAGGAALRPPGTYVKPQGALWNPLSRPL